MEIWKEINEEMIDDYLISNEGRIYRKSTNNILKETSFNPYNYVYRNLQCKDKKMRSFAIHRLVAKTFISNPNNYPVVDHIDSNTQNNKVSNLRWCTIAQNNHFRYEKEKKLGIKHGGKRVAHNEKEFKELLEQWEKKGE